MFQKFIKNSKGLENNFVNIAKILIIIFMSFSVLVNFIPFFEGSNSYHYGISSILLVEEGITKSNPFLGKEGFLIENWLLTDQNEIIPMSGHGLIALGGISYFVGGYFGLYYLSPIFFIILLITSERIATSLFGKHVGLITLILLSTSNLLFRNSIQLQTESIFCLTFVLGAYFLIKFGKENKSYLILVSSTFFVISTTIRLSGIISFPLEIFILTILIINNYLINKKTKNKKLKSKNLITLSLAIIPWIIFFLLFAQSNISNFGEPFVIYGELNESQNKYYDSSIFSLVEFERSDFENVKQYSKYLLPYIFVGIHSNIDDNFDNTFGKDWIGIIALIVLSLSFIFCYKLKNKKLETFVILVLVFGTIWFYSSITSEERAEKGVPGRYVLPAFVLSSMVFGYIIKKIFDNKIIKHKGKSKIFRFGLIIILLLFVIISFNFTSAVTMFEQNDYLKKPFKYEREFPLEENGINKNDIVVTPIGSRALEYNLIPFSPINNNKNNNDSIKLLNSIIEDYDVYAFKTPFNINERNMINNLVNTHEIILKDHSKTFCKIELSSNDRSVSDEICINNEPIRKLKANHIK